MTAREIAELVYSEYSPLATMPLDQAIDRIEQLITQSKMEVTVTNQSQKPRGVSPGYSSDFAGALSAMRNKKAVRRKAWAGLVDSPFVVLFSPVAHGMADSFAVENFGAHPLKPFYLMLLHGMWEPWVPLTEDLMAEDWEVL